MKYEFKPIGYILSPYKKSDDAPRQGKESDLLSQIVIFDEYSEGLDGIDSYTHLVVFYWLDRASRNLLKVIPPSKTRERGVFSTRSPSRPNPIALCMVQLIKREDNILAVKGLDALDKSPVLDIKPYIPDLDCIQK